MSFNPEYLAKLALPKKLPENKRGAVGNGEVHAGSDNEKALIVAARWMTHDAR
jgi:hypothetical protein